MRWGTDSKNGCESTIICYRSKDGELEGGVRGLPLISNHNIHSSRLEPIFISNNYFLCVRRNYHFVNRLILVKLRTNQQVCIGNSRWSRSASTLLEHADLVSDNEIRHVPGVQVCAELAVLVMGCGAACRDTHHVRVGSGLHGARVAKRLMLATPRLLPGFDFAAVFSSTGHIPILLHITNS